MISFLIGAFAGFVIALAIAFAASKLYLLRPR